MTTEALFLSKISKLKRQVMVKSAQQAFLYAAWTFLGICTIIFIIEKIGYLRSGEYGWWYLIFCGFSLLVGVLFVLFKQKSFLVFLIDIDTRLKLKDRLSTAYEYQIFGKKSELSDILMQDATETLGQLSRRKLFPLTFRFCHLGVILLILINIALYSSDYLLSGNAATRHKQFKLKKISSLLQNYLENSIAGQKEKKSGQPDVYTKNLETLSRNLQKGAITRDQLFTTLNRYLKDVQQRQTDLTRTLGSQLTAAKIADQPVSNIPTLQKLSARNLEKLKMLLNKIPDDQISGSIKQEIETLQELHRLETLLSQIIDDITEDAYESGALSESHPSQPRGSQHMDNLKSNRDDTRRPEIPGKYPNTKSDSEDTRRRPGSDQTSVEGRDLEKELNSRDGYSSSAGRGKSSGKKKSPTEIDKSSGPGIQDKMISSQMQKYLIHIRSLTAIGESRIKAEDIMRTYHQEIESVLQKEDIPLNYREYIKHYFLSIGLNTEENAHGSK